MSTEQNTPEVIWHNGKLIAWKNANVHILTSAVQFGASVFEGIRCYSTPAGPAIFRLPEHLRRLKDSCQIYRMALPWTALQLTEACKGLVTANQFDECYIRPMVLRGYGDMGMAAQGNPIETYIAAWKWGSYLGDNDGTGLDVCVSSWSRPAPNTFPSLAKAAGHYNNAMLIKLDALTKGFGEAIALSPDGMVSEGSGQNLFAVIDGTVITPPVDGSILSGITRSAVLHLAADLGIPAMERRIPRELLYIADELFLTGTATEIAAIGAVDRIPIGNGRIGPVTARLQATFLDAVNGRAPDKHGWLTPVNT